MYKMSIKPVGSGRKKRSRGIYEMELEGMLREKKKMNGEPYSEQSIKSFINSVVKLSSIFLGKAEVMVNLQWLEDTKKIIHFVENTENEQHYKYSLASKLAFYQSIIICLGATGMTEQTILQPYWEQRDMINLARMTHYNEKKSFDTTNGKNQTNVLNDISPADIHAMVANMDTLSFNDDKELINRKLFMISQIIKLHTQFPWRNDLADVKVVYSKTYEKKVKDGTDKDFNWLILDKQYTFVINHFKTSKKYHKIIAKVENIDLKRSLKQWLLVGMPEEVDDQYLFTWDDGRQLSRNNISVLLSAETKKFLKKSISTTLLCKIFDETPGNIEDMTIEQYNKLKEQSRIRGHDPKTRISIYRNPNNK